jgi:hypothetical protein
MDKFLGPYEPSKMNQKHIKNLNISIFRIYISINPVKLKQ